MGCFASECSTFKRQCNALSSDGINEASSITSDDDAIIAWCSQKASKGKEGAFLSDGMRCWCHLATISFHQLLRVRVLAVKAADPNCATAVLRK